MGHLQARTLGTWPVIELGPTVASWTPASYVLMRGWNRTPYARLAWWSCQ
jgi:hypothetical protein